MIVYVTNNKEPWIQPKNTDMIFLAISPSPTLWRALNAEFSHF